MPVTVQQEELDHCRVALTIEVPGDEIQKARETVFNQMAKRTNIPGFRPGKAPRHLVKRVIDEEQVRQLALERALSNAYNEALRQAEVEPYRDAEPQIELPKGEELHSDEGFSFKATIPLQPHVHLGDLEGLHGRRVAVRISDEDVERELTRFRENLAAFEPTQKPAAEGDRLRATVHTTVGGEIVEEATFPQPRLLQVGGNLPELDAGLVGLTAGEEKTFDFTYPADYGDPELAGKTATAKVHVFDVLRRTVPELDDAFAKRLEMEDVDALRNRIREMLQAQADAVADQELVDGLIDQIVARSVVHFPEEMVEAEVSSRVADLMQALERRNLTLDDYLRVEKKDLATFQAETREEAVVSLRNTLTLLELARVHHVHIHEAEVEAEVKRRAESENVKLSQMRKLLTESGELNAIRNRLFFQKVADFLRSKADVREVEA